MNRNLYVVMGITGSGKTTVGALLAQTLGVAFVEGDDYHSCENVRRMTSGIPLEDSDRWDWLRAVSNRIREASEAGTGLVLTCSALKRSYREMLRSAAPELRLVFLEGDRHVIAERLAERRDHFMAASLLDSQLATLEPPQSDEHALTYDIRESPQEIVSRIVAI